MTSATGYLCDPVARKVPIAATFGAAVSAIAAAGRRRGR